VPTSLIYNRKEREAGGHKRMKGKKFSMDLDMC
jgi:hypothetical protein